MITTLEEFKAYNKALSLGEEIWKIVSTWDFFGKDTIGKQLVRAADSIAANLSEVWGGTTTKKLEILVSMQGVLYLKRRHGLVKRIIEISSRRPNLINSWRILRRLVK